MTKESCFSFVRVREPTFIWASLVAVSCLAAVFPFLSIRIEMLREEELLVARGTRSDDTPILTEIYDRREKNVSRHSSPLVGPETGAHENPSDMEMRMERGNNKTSFSFMRSNGAPFHRSSTVERDGARANGGGEEEGGGNLTVDVLSIGSRTQIDLLRAQSRTWASHRSIRHFFGATEDDDADPTCHETLDRGKMELISNYCRSTTQQFWGHSRIMRYLVSNYAQGNYLQSKTPGWMCAQKRPSHAIGKLGRFYRAEAKTKDSSLPDYLMIVDDDTYWNMELFEDFVKDFDPSVPLAEAGCLVRSPIHLVNFSFAWGGFGLILSRGAVSNLIEPIDCSGGAQGNSFHTNACIQLDKNLIGEQDSFKSGMSVSDLMDAHAAKPSYSDFPSWNGTKPYCLHSDWATGFYLNHYQHISNHVSESERPFFANITEARTEWHLGYIYNNHPPGNCNNDNVSKCTPMSHVCHRQTAESMHNLTAVLKSSVPGKYVDL